MPKTSKTFEERFWEKVDKNGPTMPGMDSPCWVWTARKYQYGYGMIWQNVTTRTAHRVSWELAHGPIPKGEGAHGNCVLHRCDNPPCVNPDHLFLGTNQDNVRDMLQKHRQWQQKKTHCPKGHALVEDNLAAWSLRRGKRACLTCQREHSATQHIHRVPTSEAHARSNREYALALPPGTCKRGHALTIDNLYESKLRLGIRACKICKKMREAA